MTSELYKGLTDKEVAERIAKGQVNVVDNPNARTTKKIILTHTLTYFNLVNLILGILVFISGHYKQMLFLGIIFANSIIGIVQELRVKNLIERLSVVTASRCRVIRNGAKKEIPVEELVVDDIVLLSPGEQLASDGVVLYEEGLEMNESMLTGESKAVRKSTGADLLSGSFVSAGTGIQKVTKVGSSSYAARLVKKARSRHRASSEMQKTLGNIIKFVSVAIIPIGLLLYMSQKAAYGSDYKETLIHTVSGVLGMIPEGLILLTSVSFIIGVGRLAMKRALVQEMEAIEGLARVTVLCTDKTGTITTGDLTVHELCPLNGETKESMTEKMRSINAAFSDINSTQDALIRYFGQSSGWIITDRIPFSSARKYRAVAFRDRGSFVLGAPEFMGVKDPAVLNLASAYSEEGYRVLLLASSTGISSEKMTIGSLTPIGLIVIADIIKEDAVDTFRYFAENNVAVKVISGDNPRTVSAVAIKAGVQKADRYVDATTLPTTLKELRKVINNYTVFGRVRPEQKQLFVKAWQANGEVVGMVGDGVNDVLAIKDADCGIAMAAGADAAKQAAHIVLMDSDFSAMKDIVREGRTIITNIEKVSALYLTKTLYSIILCLIYIFAKASYPFTGLQLSLINFCCEAMPSFLLTFEYQDNSVSRGFLKQVLKVAAPSALTMVSIVIITDLLRALFNWPADVCSTLIMVLGGLVSMLVLTEVLWPLNLYHKFILVAAGVIYVLGILLFPGFFDVHSIWMGWSFFLVPMFLLAIILISVYSRMMNKIADPLENFLRKMAARRRGAIR